MRLFSLGALASFALSAFFVPSCATLHAQGAMPGMGQGGGQEKGAALSAMGPWLAELDAASYAQAWKDAGRTLQQKAPAEDWVRTMRATRTPFGPCQRRELLSAFGQPVPPGPGSGSQGGYFVIAQFDSFFPGKHAVENVVFEKQPDGSYKAAGYTIQPKG
ncbi:MAG: DUF4019 domain-containing protein [Verrucomicrobium sp.]|nr:DUF4019 domain-containing protein [Verrucomicrobium sp.]